MTQIFYSVRHLVLFDIEILDDNEVPVIHELLKKEIGPGYYCDPHHEEIIIICLTFPKWTYPGDTNPENNIFIDDTVKVKWPGDANGDGHCDFLDLGIFGAYWSRY